MGRIDRSLIAGLPLFSGIAAEDLDGILLGARSSRFARDTTIFETGADAHSFYVLLDGHIRVVQVTAVGQQVIVRYISAGEIFGMACALGWAAYPANAIAAVDCVVLAWPSALWAEMSSRFPRFAANTYRTVGARLQETHMRVAEMSTEQVEQRVAHALLRLLQQTGRKTPDGICIDFPISRQDIAEMTGTALHTISRLLSAWEQKGLVKSGRQQVTIVAPHRLMSLAEGHASRS